jgi:enediyne biosynthesis protein E4
MTHRPGAATAARGSVFRPAAFQVTAALISLLLAGFRESLSAADQAAWHQEPGFRWADLRVPTGGKTGFRLLPPEESGILFTNKLDERTGEANRVLFNGSGVAVGDYDQDGRPDVFFCSLEGHNALFRNLGGLRFTNVTSDSGIDCTNLCCRGAVFADITGDGFLDLLIATTGNGVRCFINDQHGHFTDGTVAAGTASRYGSVTLALADIDGDGSLDLYVANNRTDDIRDRGQVDLQMVGGKLSIPPNLQDRLVLLNGKLLEYGEPDILYRNDGHGHLTPVPWTNGAFLDERGRALSQAPLDWSLTVTFRDINGDGWPDIYECNDYWTPDRIWINDGHGRFQAANNLAFRHTSASSMGVDMADLNHSGHVDIMVVDMLSRDLRLRKRQMFAQSPLATPSGIIDNRPQFMRNTLFVNRGDGTFTEIADYAGVPASEWCWSPTFLDVDLDGFMDLLIPAGHTKDVQDLDAEAEIRARNQARGQLNRIADPKARLEAFIQNKIQNSHLYPSLEMPIVAFRNRGQYQFEETTALWGTDQPGVHHSLALGDLDGDGDLDFVVNNLGMPAGVYQNNSSAPRVAVRFQGAPPNRQGIGAQVTLLDGATPTQTQEIIAGGRYMSGSEALAVFAAGQAKDGMTLKVRWRSGKQSVAPGVKPNRIYEIDETAAVEIARSPDPAPKPLFEDVSHLLGHSHQDEDFNDYERQPLLPRKLSQLGPGVAWADIDGDGRDDLVIGSGRGGQLAIFRNDGKGGFIPLHSKALDAPTPQDQTGLIVAPIGAAPPLLLVGSSDYEDPTAGEGGVWVYVLGGESPPKKLPIKSASVGPLALGDMDGKENLDLFVAGRVIPGRYPEAAASVILRNHDGTWEPDAESNRALSNVGLVSGAVWSDLDGDGLPELVLACEWGPIRVFKKSGGKLAEATENFGLSGFRGWWNGVTTADVDGTGRMAIVASNWGLNTPYHSSPEHPVSVVFGEFAGRGFLDLVEAEYDPALQAVAPRRMREALAVALPNLLARFPTRKAYSEAPLHQVLASLPGPPTELQVNTLASTVFIRHGQQFEAHPLPMEAQFSPAFGVTVADFDGDGREDVFLSQNFFANQPEVPRFDAGRGLLLRGDGLGGFLPVPGQTSGIQVYGEGRGTAVADFDQDGRPDLVVAQNGGETRLFRNASGKPGLTVRLRGPKGNPAGIGAQVRLRFADHDGPVRETHAGSGYWSQDALAPVLAMPSPATAVWVRWPGGRVTQQEIHGTPREVKISFPE